MKKLLLGMVLLGAVISASAWAKDSDELWEVEAKMDMGISIPGMAMPTVTNTACLSKGEYKPEKFLQEKNCEMTDLKVVSNKTSWKVRCSGQVDMEAEGEVIRNADTLSGVVYVTTNGMQMTQIISGKRIGTCQQE